VAVADSASTLAARAAAGPGAAAVGCGHALCAARLGSTRQQGSRAPAQRRGRRAKRTTQFYCSCARELDALCDASWGRQPAVRPARRIVGAPASRAPTSALRLRADNSRSTPHANTISVPQSPAAFALADLQGRGRHLVYSAAWCNSSHLAVARSVQPRGAEQL